MSVSETECVQLTGWTRGWATHGSLLPRPSPRHLFVAWPTRHVRGESAGLVVAAAFGLRQLVGAFARGTGECAASWLALADAGATKSPHSKRWRACERARLSRSQVCATR